MLLGSRMFNDMARARALIYKARGTCGSVSMDDMDAPRIGADNDGTTVDAVPRYGTLKVGESDAHVDKRCKHCFDDANGKRLIPAFRGHPMVSGQDSANLTNGGRDAVFRN